MKILILETRKLSYGSSSVFLSNIRDILKEYGEDVTHCVINDPEADSELLESFIGKSFDAVLDVNSILPLAECDYGKYLDCIDAPFINFIIDHPMHVHEYLNVNLQRYYVICLDKRHKEYIGRYYPHIKKTAVIPLAGARLKKKECPDGAGRYAPGNGYKQFAGRRYHIFFPATYTPPSYYRQVMEDINAEYARRADLVIHSIMDGDKSPVHDIYKKIAPCSDSRFAEEMYKARFIDRYVRDYFRDAAVRALLEEGYAVDVAGARWNMFESGKTGGGKSGRRRRGRLILHGQCSYGELPGLVAESQIVLNVQPLFTETPHDRVFIAMANTAAVLTDACGYIGENYMGDMLVYDKRDIAGSLAKMEDIMYDTRKLYAMAVRLEKALGSETWEERCNRFMEFVNNL